MGREVSSNGQASEYHSPDTPVSKGHLSRRAKGGALGRPMGVKEVKDLLFAMVIVVLNQNAHAN